jgi:phosphocarrier protein HPr
MEAHSKIILIQKGLVTIKGENNMKDISCSIHHSTGLHARPAGLFVQTAQKYVSKITVSFKDNTVNAKSLLGLLGLGVVKDSEILITAEGKDEEEVIIALVKLIESNFGESISPSSISPIVRQNS